MGNAQTEASPLGPARPLPIRASSTLTRWQHAKAEAIASLGTPVLEALGGMYRWHEAGTEHVDRVIASGRQPIVALWHGRIFAGTLYLRDRGLIVIISESFDGEWIARIIRRFGYGTVRGSSSRGGARALVQLRRDMRAGHPAAFTVDGPRGPARVAQPGVVWLAGTTGNPIVPFHVEASSFWTAKSWDRHQVPKPGSHVVAMFGSPIDVPAEPDEAAIAAGQRALSESLARLEARARALALECRG